LRHYFANQSTFGAGSVVTTQSGFDVSSTLVGATNNYGFRGAIPAGTNRWNIYMDGTADNYLAGNVGIGTASPSRKLDISTGSDTDAGLIGITIGGTVANSRQAIIEKQTSGTRTLSIYSSLSSTSLEPISFYTGIGYERLTILEGGNVGIGSTAPSGKLEVNTASGTAYFTRTAGDNGTTAPAIGIATASTAPRMYSYGDLQFWNAAVGGTATNKMTLFANGNLAVGTTTDAGYKLDVNGTGRFSSSVTAGSNVVIPSGYELVYGTGTVSILGNSTSNFLDFRTSNSTKLYINSSGNVGIGTSSPTQILDVNGPRVRMGDGGGFELNFNTSTYAAFQIASSERMRITSGGEVLMHSTTFSSLNAGQYFGTGGDTYFTTDTSQVLYINRKGNDGTLVDFRRDNSVKGTISVSGETVSYNSFLGSHWSQLQDGSKIEILKGTIIEAIDEMCVWQDETNDRLPKSKISDTIESKNVYGIFLAWDEDWETSNDFYVAAVGLGYIRVNSSQNVSMGDLLQSNGDGTAKVQTDDIMRSSTIAKVVSTQKIETYEDGSYLIAATIHCG